MKAWFVKLPNGDLRPLEENALKRMVQGEAWEFEYKKKRNYKFLQKFFVFITAVYGIEKIQKAYISSEHLRYVLTMDAGYFEEVKSLSGKIYLKRKSISFKEMEENDFDQFYSKVMQIVLDNLPDYCEDDIHQLEKMVLNFC